MNAAHFQRTQKSFESHWKRYKSNLCTIQQNSCKYASDWHLRANLKMTSWNVAFRFPQPKFFEKTPASLAFKTEYVCSSSHIRSYLLISTVPLLLPAKPKLPFVIRSNSSLGIHEADYQPREWMSLKTSKVMLGITDPQPMTVGFTLLSWIANKMQIKIHMLQSDNIWFTRAHNQTETAQLVEHELLSQDWCYYFRRQSPIFTIAVVL